MNIVAHIRCLISDSQAQRGRSMSYRIAIWVHLRYARPIYATPKVGGLSPPLSNVVGGGELPPFVNPSEAAVTLLNTNCGFKSVYT